MKDDDAASNSQENIYENIQPTIEVDETKRLAEVENCLLTTDNIPSLIDCSFTTSDAPVTGIFFSNTIPSCKKVFFLLVPPYLNMF